LSTEVERKCANGAFSAFSAVGTPFAIAGTQMNAPFSIASHPATATLLESARGRRSVAVVLLCWFVAATALGASGVLPTLPRFAFPILVWGTFFCWLAMYKRSADVRTALSGIGLWVPLTFHAVVRTVYGIGIWYEGTRGGFPELFADVAGPGDVVVGLLALPALFFSNRRDRVARWVLFGWNALALLDIVIVFLLAQRVLVFGEGPSAFPAVQYFPYAWLPLFVLPLVFATHVWVFARLRQVQ
jgi:hypothetical protein